MNMLNCNVQDCTNNQNNMCCLSKIQVEGPGACVKDQTCCFSFVEKGQQQAKNVANAYATQATNVKCKAGNCKYNKKGKCTAEHLSVTNMSNHPHVMGETFCSTFKAR